MLKLKIDDRIRNRDVIYFNRFTLNLIHDSVASSFGLQFFFDPYNPEHKELSCVSHFHKVTLEFNDELVLTGQLLSQRFRHSSTKEMAEFSGYSLPGVLEDCEIPTSIYPLQSDGLTLAQIASKLLKPFGLKYAIDQSVSERMNKVFKKSTASDSQTVKSYLTEIASQKKIILSHNEKGELLFTESKTNSDPVLTINASENGLVGVVPGSPVTATTTIPVTSMELNFNGQGMHSHITLQKQASIDGGNAGENTIRNPYVIESVFRPTVKSQSSGDDNDTSLAARQELSNEIKGLTLTIEIEGWTIENKIIRPNSIIEVFDPELYIYKNTRWFVESVNYTGDEKEIKCTLNCVLPEVYSNEIPKSIFAGINLH